MTTEQLSMVGSTTARADEKPAVPKCCSCGKAIPISEHDTDIRGRNGDGAVCGWYCGYRLAMRVISQQPWVLALLVPRLLAPDGSTEERETRAREASAKIPKRQPIPTKEEQHREYELPETASVSIRCATSSRSRAIGGRRAVTCTASASCTRARRESCDGAPTEPARARARQIAILRMAVETGSPRRAASKLGIRNEVEIDDAIRLSEATSEELIAAGTYVSYNDSCRLAADRLEKGDT